MIRLGIFLILLCVSSQTQAQNDIRKILDKATLVYDENPAESYSLCETAEREAETIGNNEHAGNISLCKARYLILIARFDEGMAELNKAILFFKHKNDQYNLTTTYSLKSLLLGKMGDEEASHLMLLEVLEINRQFGDIDGIIGSLQNLTLDYKDFGQADSMLMRLDELSSMTDKFRADDFYYYYQNWGSYYILTENYPRATQQYEFALKVAEDEKMTDSKATCLMYLSLSNRLDGKLQKANDYGQESYRFSQENNLIYETSEALVEWIAAKEELGDYAGAFEIQKKWIRINNEIYDMEKIQKMKTIEGQLEIAEKEQALAEGEIALQKSNLAGEKARTRNAWLIGIVLLVIVLLVFTAFIYAKTKKLNTTINIQKKEVELKSLNLETALTSVHDSLNYSKLIQGAMLPKQDQFDSAFDEHFILFKPKDIVSGDFYWLHQEGNLTIYAVGDCTGHGVPGAMVSMVCHEALNKAVIEKKNYEPAKILDEVRRIIEKIFQNRNENLNDGMDIALCAIEGNHLEYAGAHNPLWLIRKKELIEVKADKQPIGKFDKKLPFVNHVIELEKQDSLYIFSDGFSDQFGGEKGKKFKTANFKLLLKSVQNKSMENQKKELDETFENWKGALEQLDDVCVIGVRV